jgi:hypothetical protein
MKLEMQKLLTEKEAAEFLRLKPNTLKAKRHAGLPPKFIKASGKKSKILYDINDLKEYLGLTDNKEETK